jgi:hypothetical protein
MGLALSLPIGDAIHNMRAALDHVWNTLARERNLTGFPTFPFHETRQNLIDMVGKSPVANAFPETRRLIFDEIRPHRDCGGNELFWTITKLDKIDKHNLLVPTVEVTKVKKLKIRSGGRTLEIIDCTYSNFLHFGKFQGPVEYEGDIEIGFEIKFPEDNYLPGQPVISSLIEMAQATRNSVDLFRETFL